MGSTPYGDVHGHLFAAAGQVADDHQFPGGKYFTVAVGGNSGNRHDVAGDAIADGTDGLGSRSFFAAPARRADWQRFPATCRPADRPNAKILAHTTRPTPNTVISEATSRALRLRRLYLKGTMVTHTIFRRPSITLMWAARQAGIKPLSSPITAASASPYNAVLQGT